MSSDSNVEHKVDLWPVEDLIPYESNAKKHPKEQVDKLVKSITKFGWTQPIVVWKNGEIIAGHGRRLAAIKKGMKKVPVIVRSDLSKAEADALRLADNRVTSTEYDQGAIQEELARLSAELEGTDVGLEDLGFDERELDFSMAELGAINDDHFADDIATAVAEQQESNEKSIGDTDESAAPVTDALGFKRVTVAQSREIREVMTKIQPKEGESFAQAFIEIIRRGVEAA